MSRLDDLYNQYKSQDNINKQAARAEFQPLILNDNDRYGQTQDIVGNNVNGQDMPQYVDTNKNVPEQNFVQPDRRSYYVAGNFRNNEINTTAQKPNEIEYEADTIDDEKQKDSYFGLTKLLTNKKDIVKKAIKNVVGVSMPMATGLFAGEKDADLTKQAARGFAGSAVDFVSSMYRFYRQNIDIAKTYTKEQLDKIANAGNVVAGGENFADEIAEKYTEFYKQIDEQNTILRDKTERFLQYTGIARNDKDGFVYDLAGGGASLLFAIGLFAITKSPSAAAEFFGAYQYQSLYEEGIDNGYSPAKARTIGVIGGAAEGVLEGVGLHMLIETMVARKSLTKILKGALVEFTQEASQQGFEETLATVTGMREQGIGQILNNVFYAGVIGAILGGGSATVSNVFYKQISDNATQALIEKGASSDQAKQMVNNILNLSVSQQVAQEIKDIIRDEQSPVTYKNADPRETYKDTGEAIKKALDPEQQRGIELEFIEAKKKLTDDVARVLINSGKFNEEAAYRQAEAKTALADSLARIAFEQENIRPEEYYKRFHVNVNSGNIEADERNIDENNVTMDTSFDPADFDEEVRKQYEDMADAEQEYMDSLQEESKSTLKKEARIMGEMGIGAIRRPTPDGYGKERWAEYNDLSPRIKKYFFTDDENAMKWDEAEDLLQDDLFEYLTQVDGRAETYNQKDVYNRVFAKEKQKIKEKAVADGTFMKAPNGKDTNLSEELWLTVRTKAFKSWFGDWENDPANASKVVDENGEPLVVYHGSEEIFRVFDRTKGRANMDIQGSFFSPWELDAKGYGRNLYPVFLNIKNPANWNKSFGALQKYQGQNEAGIKAREDLIKQGYDGVNNDNEEYIVFDSKQVKSVNNRGNFDAGNADIYYQAAWHGGPRDFDKFDLSYAFTGEGGMAHAWGVYTAEQRNVSEGYRQRLSKDKILYDGNPISDKVEVWLDKVLTNLNFYNSENKLQRLKNGIKETIKYNENAIKHYEQEKKKYQESLDLINKNKNKTLAELQVIAKQTFPLNTYVDTELFNDEQKTQTEQEIIQGIIKSLQKQIKIFDEEIADWTNRANELKNMDLDKWTIEETKGQLFKVDIPENDVLLDEQETFDKQPEKVQDAIIKIGNDLNIDALKFETKGNFLKRVEDKFGKKARDIFEKIYDIEARREEEERIGILKAETLQKAEQAWDEWNKFEEENNIDRDTFNPNYVYRIIENAKITGRRIYENIVYHFIHNKDIDGVREAAKQASLLLNKYGVKGETYEGGLDGRAYVIFDDKAVKILEKFYQDNINEVEKKIFVPEEKLNKQFTAEAKKQINDKSEENPTIDMGKVPFLYQILGIQDVELKTNKKALQKGTGRDKDKQHNVPDEVAENLISYVYNPRAVFKSLSNSSNPDGYVAVLDAVYTDPENNEKKPIVAILSPSKNGKGFTLIPTIYERNKFAKFIEDTAKEGKILYIENKEKGADVWGQLQLLPRQTQLLNNNVLQKSDIVKSFFQQQQEQGENRGATTVYDRQYYIDLFANADKSTLMHEMAHAYLSEILYFANMKNATQKVIDIKKQLDKWLGEPENNGRYSKRQQEMFAQNFEIYLKEGKAPTAKLKTVFERFKVWLSEIYDRIKDDLPKISDDVRELFDNILSRTYDVPDSNIYAGKEKAIKEVIENAKKGIASEVDGITIDDVYNLLNMAYMRKPRKPSKNLKQLLNDKNIYDFNELNKAGADNVLQILKDGGYVKEDATAEQAVELAKAALDGKPVYRLADAWRVAGDTDFARNLRMLEKVIEFSQIDSVMEKILNLQQEGYRNVEQGDVEAVKSDYKRLFSADVKEAKKIVEDIINRLHKKRFIDMKAKKQMLVDLNFSDSVEEIKESVLNVIEDLQDEIKAVKEQIRRPRKPVVKKDKTIPPAKNATEEEKNIYKKYMRKQIDRLLKQALPRKQNQQKFSKFDEQTQRFFSELEKYNKMTMEEAQTELYKRATNIIDDEGVGLDNFEKMKNMFLSYKANKVTANSTEFYKQLYDNLQDINVFGRNAKDIENTLKKEQLQKDIDELVVNIEDNKSKNGLTTGIKKQYIKWLGNWWSTINAIAGKKQADKNSLEKIEINIFNRNYKETENLKTKCAAALGLKNATDLDMTVNRYLNEEFTYNELDPRSNTNNAVKLNKMQLICCYIWMKNSNLRDRIVRAYGNLQIDDMMSKLTIQDKKFGDELQKAVADLYDDVNAVYLKMYGLDMPQAENYFPSAVERIQGNMDLLKDNIGQVSSPGFIKARVESNLPLMSFGNPVKIALDHITKVTHFVHMQEKLADLNKVYKTTVVKRHITNAYGDRVYAYILQVLDNAKFTTVAKTIDGISDVGDYLVNNYVLTKIAVKPSITIKQLLSCINYAEDMSSVDWFKGFLKGVATPKKTIDFMMKNSKYCQSRFAKGGQTEALLKAMEGSNATFAKVKTFKGLLSWMTRVGDIGAIIFGGYPYVMDQMSKGVPLKTAIENFERATIRSQQASLPSTLSNWQYRGMNSWLYRAMFAFANTPNQYSRKIGDTMYMFFHGDINKKQFAKNLMIYGVLNSILYNSFTSLAILTGLVSGDWDDFEDDIIMSLMQTSNVLALPIISQAYNSFVSKIVTGDFVPDKEIPLLDDMVKIMRTAAKEELEFNDYLAIIDEVASLVAGVPVKTLYNEFVGSVKDFMDGEYGKFAVKLYGATESRANKIFDN